MERGGGPSNNISCSNYYRCRRRQMFVRLKRSPEGFELADLSSLHSMKNSRKAHLSDVLHMVQAIYNIVAPTNTFLAYEIKGEISSPYFYITSANIFNVQLSYTFTQLCIIKYYIFLNNYVFSIQTCFFHIISN